MAVIGKVMWMRAFRGGRIDQIAGGLGCECSGREKVSFRMTLGCGLENLAYDYVTSMGNIECQSSG